MIEANRCPFIMYCLYHFLLDLQNRLGATVTIYLTKLVLFNIRSFTENIPLLKQALKSYENWITQAIKTKIKSRNTSNYKALISKGNSQLSETAHRMGETVSKPKFKERLISKIYKEVKQLNCKKNPNNQNKKWAKYTKKHLS